MRVLSVLGMIGLLAAVPAGAERDADFRDFRLRTLQPSGRIKGNLVDPAGQGLRGMVALSALNGAVISEHHCIATRGGQFETGRLAPGRYLLRVTSLGPITAPELERPAPLEVVVQANRTARPVLTATPGTPADRVR